MAVTPSYSELGALLEAAAAERERFVRPAGASLPYQGDVRPFAYAGVPYLWFCNGIFSVENGVGWGRERNEELINYHLVSDEYDAETWDLEGAVELIEIYIEVATEVANMEGFPQWTAESVFQRPGE